MKPVPEESVNVAQTITRVAQLVSLVIHVVMAVRDLGTQPAALVLPVCSQFKELQLHVWLTAQTMHLTSSNIILVATNAIHFVPPAMVLSTMTAFSALLVSSRFTHPILASVPAPTTLLTCIMMAPFVESAILPVLLAQGSSNIIANLVHRLW